MQTQHKLIDRELHVVCHQQMEYIYNSCNTEIQTGIKTMSSVHLQITNMINGHVLHYKVPTARNR